MRVQLTKSTMFILAGSLIVVGLILPVPSYAGLSFGYYYGGHHSFNDQLSPVEYEMRYQAGLKSL